MPGEFGVPEGGTEVEGVLGSRAGRVLGTVGALIGTFVVLVGSALTVDFINRHDPRNEIDSRRTLAEQFRSDILSQRMALEAAANNQRGASRAIIDEASFAQGKFEDAERAKQALDLAFDNYQATFDNIRVLLVDAIQNFELGGDADHPEQSQLGVFFGYEQLMLDKAALFESCLETNVENMRFGRNASATAPNDSADASAPPDAPRRFIPNVQCAAALNTAGVSHDAFMLDDYTLGALHDCETAFGHGLVDAARILNRTATVNRTAADRLALADRLTMEARNQRLWQGTQASDWAPVEAALQTSCEPLRQFGAPPQAQQ